jgi:cytochrome c-type biogenesis protein CcmH/NrfG
VAAVVGVVAVVALAGWIVWQPLRSADADAAATNAMLGGNPAAAIAYARTAAASDPVAVDPLWELAAFYIALGNLPAAHHELASATSLQPSNPATWEQLAGFDLQHGRAAEAVGALHNALRLDRGSVQAQQLMARARARLGHG